MPSRPFLVLGNIAAITVTIAAFLQALAWTYAGILILVFLVLPLLTILAPKGSLPIHPSSKTMPTSHHTQTLTRPPQHPTEKHSSQKLEPKPAPRSQAAVVIEPNTVPRTTPTATSNQQTPPRSVPVRTGPNYNPTIAKGDYVEYDVELEKEMDFTGEVTADGLINTYLLDGENLDNLDEGEEFWSETGEEEVESASLEFTAPTKGKWFFVVENADEQPVTVTVKLHKSPASQTAVRKVRDSPI